MTTMREFFSQGRAAKKGLSIEDVDWHELTEGVAVEMEHTDDVKVATKIALDHLAEHPMYYRALAQMEQDLEDGLYG